MSKIKIVADTGADLTEEQVKEYDIGLFRFFNIFDEESYVSGTDMTSDEFFQKMEQTGIVPTTAQAPYADMLDALEKYTSEYDTVIVFTLSSKASGQNNTLHMIKRDIEEENSNADIRIIDSETFSLGIAVGVIRASELVKGGADADTVEKQAREYMKKWDVYFLVDNLKYLEKGGRINKASAVIGGILDIKPILSVRNGLVEAVDKLRGKKRVTEKLIAKIKDNPRFDADAKRFAVVYADKDRGEEAVSALKEEFDGCDIVMYNQLGSVIGTHTGPGLVGIFFETKD